MNARKAPDVPLLIFLGVARALAALALGAGCSGKPLPAPPALPLPHPPAPATAASDDPGHWVYHPTSSELVLAVQPLEEGGCLLATEYGQRWVTRPAAALKTGQSDSAATSPTPQRLW